MPKGESWWNPYRFVPAREEVERRAPNTDERFQGKSGFISCSLSNYTLLFIGGGSQGQQRFIMKQGNPFLPGSSLKGMLRALVEVVGGGCFVYPSDHNCRQSSNLCVACRMFGMMYKGDVHKGQINISDGKLEDERPQWQQVYVLQGQPKKDHTAFYKHPLTGAWAQKMMKMYFHQPNRTSEVLPVPAQLQQRAVLKHMLQPGHTFTFTVYFENLEDEELNLLLYALALEEDVQVTLTPEELQTIALRGPMLHKLGNAKGQGPGSCKIKIEELTVLQPAHQRYTSLHSNISYSWIGEELLDEIQERTAGYRQGVDESPTMQFLRKMMVWDESDARQFKYPEYSWFNATANKNTELKSI